VAWAALRYLPAETAHPLVAQAAAVQILKDYMEAGSFSRGREELVAETVATWLARTLGLPDAPPAS
jgi:hypothetical protein